MRHIETHTVSVRIKTKKHKCEVCNKEFAPNNLKKRIDSVHNKIKYYCEICFKEFSRYDNLKKHNESVHNKM